MSASSSRGILFDLDGTLVDSLPDIIDSFLHAFGHLGLPAPTYEQVRALIGHPLDWMYSQFAPDHVPALCVAYREHYPLNFHRRSRPYPGVVEVLRALRERGYLLAVATTKRPDMARKFVDAMGLGPLLHHVQGTDGFPHKPAPDVIHHALAALGTGGLWMVGDTALDLRAGQAAGLRTYAVTWGTHPVDVLAGASPDELQPDLQRLLTHLPPLA
ncbi:HAD-superfamily hydrolase, subfamily IA, variant 3 [Myxococcus xanthus DK 1622]|uniref:phosphoglycolate phosphatase n=1 Tax=Myxococcus xanthus (strain DK1622) TaxID=246197 RepID=Q1CZC6_MYXXD|nr:MULTISPECIES: HAD-IA family hydrolase [Myxococcus]ABF87011.1 HAD-superfamily hydrolase, subfamily IA, variant 3 [Myxococcus xanthus DK 1622]NOJ57468.1 HAD-IA family hydrolase [Myxococcus xanthus]QPM78509.1 HAD-IA family hydrolase [Myxococcus xanthus]QVW67577.1 HAD-IA family hydrolase [Myxococcus xanthus DZ2]QZZ53749.1 Pyrophosphatase PpaX [Myxococcus xanthus]